MSARNDAERRGSERTRLDKYVTLTTTSKSTSKYYDAVALDVSAHGARVRSKAALTPGELVDFIADSLPDIPYVMRSQVVWMSKGLSEAGLKFVEPVQMKRAPKAKPAMMA